MAELIGSAMESHGVKFHRGWIPVSIKKLADSKDSKPPRLLVTAKETDGKRTVQLEVNTVVLAVGRDACTQDLNLNATKLNKNTK
jgi:pyruvate/2-oxoglutarate dehydrogenase complex dihydrolipoamide dehydrogenase (E3) component